MQALWLLSLVIVFLLMVSSSFGEETTVGSKKKGDPKQYYKRTNLKFVEEAAKKPGVIKFKSGLVVEILKTTEKPDAKSPNVGDPCKVTYTGTFKDGKQFDAGTHEFAPNQVIPAWTEAMQYMAEGDKWRLVVPYNLGYGEEGNTYRIPGYSTLVFEMEIKKVKSGGKPVAEARKKMEENIEFRNAKAEL
eukprot:gene40379-49210_t